jgi:uncharacterized membrane protein YjgN (DUF898 family)
MAQNTSLNGVRYSFTDITMVANSAPQFGGLRVPIPKGILQSINYDAQQDAGIVQGNQIAIVGRTNGYGTATGSMELLVSEFDDFANIITVGGTTPLMSVFFDLSIAYSVNKIDVRTDVLVGIKITKVGSANQKGSDAAMVSLDLNIANLFKNGIAMFGDPAF